MEAEPRCRPSASVFATTRASAKTENRTEAATLSFFQGAIMSPAAQGIPG